MKCYTDPKTTPLKFHKIFHRILLPLWILGTFVGAFRLLSYADYAAYFSILTFIYLGAGAALVACFLGLGTWERYAWYSLMGVLSGMLLMQIVISSVNLQSGFSDISDFLGELIGAFASYGLILLYYYKRRGLFFRPSFDSAPPENLTVETSVADDGLDELKERLNQLETENKVLSSLHINASSENSRLKKQASDYRHMIEEKNATIFVLEKRLENPVSSEPVPSCDKNQIEALKRKILDQDIQLEQLQKRYDKLDEDYAADLDKVDFVDNLLVFLEKDSKLYHCYGCPQFKTSFDYEDSFLCCDRRTAQKMGYTPCAFCINSNSELCVGD